MKALFALLLLLTVTTAGYSQTREDSIMIRKIFDFALTEGQCYQVLEHLCTKVGPRLSGSQGAADAVQYTKQAMEKFGFDKVFLQDVMVPHWERGQKEHATIIAGNERIPVNISALGNSVATGAQGVQGEVIEVHQVDDLDKLGREKVEGKIVFFNRAFDPRPINTFEAYAGCVDQRYAGASKAAKYGAKAVVVRSMTHIIDDFPHTGNMGYDPQYPKIPAVAISTLGAEKLSSMLKTSPQLNLHYFTDCRNLPDAPSHNVVGQLNGKERPNEFMICGGHLDAWDNGQGAHDDGAGCVQSMEALRILKELGYQPRHSLRAVMYMNEENGGRGGRKYAELAVQNKEVHRFAIESDRGGFTPRGYSIDHGKDTVDFLQRFRPLLEPYGLHNINKGGSGADVGPLKKTGTVVVGYVPDSQRYFDIHHAGSDTFDKINKRELEMGAASMAAILYLMDKYWDKKD